MPFQIIRNDITKVKADAIVNTANPRPVIGSGTERAIYKAANEKLLLKERQAIGEINPGAAAYTSAFNLNAKYIIHTVGPEWTDGNHGEQEILHACYRNSLNMAATLSCKSIAFPLIATGIYGFPKDLTLQIALYEINAFLLSHDMKVILVVFDKKAFTLSEKLVGDIKKFIDEKGNSDLQKAECGPDYCFGRNDRKRRYLESEMLPEPAPGTLSNETEEEESDGIEGMLIQSSIAVLPNVSGKSLDEMLNTTEDSFQKRLFKLIDESGMDDVTVYKKANIDRKVFSRIRCKEDYKPKKKTAVAFAIALQLDMPTMLDLLSRAEIAFSPSNKFDLIITYFITNKVYDIFEINSVLFKYGQPLLGE